MFPDVDYLDASHPLRDDPMLERWENLRRQAAPPKSTPPRVPPQSPPRLLSKSPPHPPSEPRPLAQIDVGSDSELVHDSRPSAASLSLKSSVFGKAPTTRPESLFASDEDELVLLNSVDGRGNKTNEGEEIHQDDEEEDGQVRAPSYSRLVSGTNIYNFRGAQSEAKSPIRLKKPSPK